MFEYFRQKPEQTPIQPFAFLDPFAGPVWQGILVTTVLVGIYVSVLNKLSPYDYHGEFVYLDNENQEKK